MCLLDLWFRETNFHLIYAQQKSSPFLENVVTRSLSDYRQESLTRQEKPLLVADQDYYVEEFRNF